MGTSPDGARLVIQAERDGDTVSPERGVYFMDLNRRVTRDELRARLRASLDAEQALRAKAQKLCAPIATAVRAVAAEASVAHFRSRESAVRFRFEAHHAPGNKLAAAYLFEAARRSATPEYQTFECRPRRGGQTGRTSNVLATLKGTVNPELVYVVSSHYDSVAAGPGPTTTRQEPPPCLRPRGSWLSIRSRRPSSLRRSRVRKEGCSAAVSSSGGRGKVRIVGALNNDMVGMGERSPAR